MNNKIYFLRFFEVRMFILSYCVCRCCRLTCHYFLPAYKPTPRISPPVDRPIKKALRTQISPGLIGGEIRYCLVEKKHDRYF